MKEPTETAQKKTEAFSFSFFKLRWFLRQLKRKLQRLFKRLFHRKKEFGGFEVNTQGGSCFFSLKEVPKGCEIIGFIDPTTHKKINVIFTPEQIKRYGLDVWHDFHFFYDGIWHLFMEKTEIWNSAQGWF